MGLIGKYSVLTKWHGQTIAGSTVSNLPSNFNKNGANARRFNGGMAKIASTPSGYTPPGSWVLARSDGGIGLSRDMDGSGAINSANLAGGLNGESSLSGAGDITNAALGLIVSAVAALSGSGAVTAAILGKLEAAADLAGAGDINAALGALAGLASALTGTGALSADIIAKATIAADIVVTGDVLNSANVGDAVWGALASASNVTGTMGEKLNDAGSASNPWTEVIESGYTAAEVLKILLAVNAGKSSGGGTTNIKFRDIGDTTDRIDATVDSSGNRTAVTIDAT